METSDKKPWKTSWRWKGSKRGRGFTAWTGKEGCSRPAFGSKDKKPTQLTS